MGSSKLPTFSYTRVLLSMMWNRLSHIPQTPWLFLLVVVPYVKELFFFQQGLIQALVEFNLHEGTPQMRSDVRHLLCLLTKDNEHATVQLNEILIGAVAEAVNSHKSNPAVVSKPSLFV